MKHATSEEERKRKLNVSPKTHSKFCVLLMPELFKSCNKVSRTTHKSQRSARLVNNVLVHVVLLLLTGARWSPENRSTIIERLAVFGKNTRGKGVKIR